MKKYLSLNIKTIPQTHTLTFEWKKREEKLKLTRSFDKKIPLSFPFSLSLFPSFAFTFVVKTYLHKTQHTGRKSQRRCDGQSEAALVITNAFDWLSHLRCDLRSACCVLCRWVLRQDEKEKDIYT